MLFDNDTASSTAQWHQEPNRRGSFTILSGCLITLGLCIWTSIHLNVPNKCPSKNREFRAWDPRGWVDRQLKRKMRWLVVGLLAPEMVAFAAFWQRRHARQISRLVRKTLAEQTNQKTTGDGASLPAIGRRHEWTDVHSFYAVMGGIAFDTSDLPSEEQFLPRDYRRLVPSQKGLKFIIEQAPWLLPDISIGEIEDKSKADRLAKFIVCAQATWFFVQVVYRLAAGCSISLLELNTTAHALCALLIFYLWWDKPLDVAEPSVISGPYANEMCAFISFYCDLGDRRDADDLIWADQDEDVTEVSAAASPWGRFADVASDQELPSASGSENNGDDEEKATKIMYNGQRIGGVILRDYGHLRRPSDRRRPRFDGYPYDERIRAFSSDQASTNGVLNLTGPLLYYSPLDHRRWTLASTLLRLLPSIDLASFAAVRSRRRLRRRIPNFKERLFRRHPTVSTFDTVAELLISHNKHFAMIAIIAAGLFYSGLHLLAWQYPFPTALQQTLWRASGIVIGAFGFLILSQDLLAQLLAKSDAALFQQLPKFGKFLPEFVRKRAAAPNAVYFLMTLVNLTRIVITLTSLLLMSVAVLLYLLARIYLVLECFVSFPYLSEGVFAEPQWSSVFPHIT